MIEEQNEDKQVKGRIMNLPNILTYSRIIMIPVIIMFFYLNFTGHYLVSLSVFGIASFTDFLDGKIARKYNLVTNLGKFLDPIADKALVLSALVVFLTVPYIFTQSLGEWALITAGCGVAVIIIRELAVSGIRMVAAESKFVIAADIFGKIKTFTQDICIVVLLLGEGVRELTDNIAGTVINYIGLGFFAVSIVLTVISGINYLVKNIAVLKQ